MGRKAIDKTRALNPQVRKEWLDLLVPYFLQNGFYQVTIEDITKYLGVSKATLYEHFSSRDELYALVVDHVLEQISANRDILRQSEYTYHERYVYLYGMILQQVTGITPMFLEDIKVHFPTLWQKVQDFYYTWEADLKEFFEAGMQEGAFVQINPAVLSRMVTALLKELISPEFLITNNITLQNVFLDFFKMQSQGIFNSEQRTESQLEELLSSIIRKTLEKPRLLSENLTIQAG